MTATCEPPEEHKDKPWHWLRRGANAPRPVGWGGGSWWDLPGWCDPVDPDEAYGDGWRYVAPAIPPGDEEGA